MKKLIIFSLIFSVIAFAAPALAGSCWNCHKDLPEEEPAAAKHPDWLGSAHEQNGISCSRCHGGRPDKDKKKNAHRGVKNSGNKRSKTYTSRIHNTCGSCHTKEYQLFTQSEHYLRVESSGKGPNCVVCHGSIGTSLIGIDEIENLCSSCHMARLRINSSVPKEAKDTLMLIEETRTVIRLASELLSRTENPPPDAAARLEKARKIIQGANMGWHSFKLKPISVKVHESYKMAKTLVDDILAEKSDQD